MSLSIIILAAGKGTRMKSSKSKILHCVAGKPILQHVLDTAFSLKPEEVVVVYGHDAEQVRNHFREWSLTWVEQAEQLGTGHAVAQALPHVNKNNKVLVLYADVPLVDVNTLKPLLELQKDQLSLLSVKLDNPTGYGRIIRNQENQFLEIVEHKDASNEQLEINEVNTGILAGYYADLKKFIDNLSNDNVQKEYYLTDIFANAVKENILVKTMLADKPIEVEGINNRKQLASIERYYQQKRADQLMENGVTLLDPSRLDIRGNVTIENDVTIDINVILEGDVKIGQGCQIGANTSISDSVIESNTQIFANCVIENSLIKSGCRIGPFARIRPDSELNENVHIGNFVEIKKSVVKTKSKINHLSYIGDSEVGSQVNIGAGTITCNYDGANKYKTTIGDNAFIGSCTQMVAPVTIGEGATIGAGSTITTDAPEHKLTISRAKQRSIEGWQRPVKKTK